MIAAAAVALNLGVSISTAVASCAAPRACAGGLFRDTSRQGTVDPGAGLAVRRARRVEIDVGRVVPGGEGPSAARLTLNPFPDVCVTALRERVTDLGRGAVQWEGRVPGASPGTVTLIVDGTLMVGTLRIDREIYEIRYLGDGVHLVTDIDPSKFPRD